MGYIDEKYKRVDIKFNFKDLSFMKFKIDESVWAYIENDVEESKAKAKRAAYRNAYSRISNAVQEGKIKLKNGMTTKQLAQEEIRSFNPKLFVTFVIDRENFFKNYTKVKDVYDQIATICKGNSLDVAIYEELKKQKTSAPVNYTYTADQFNKIVEFYDYTRCNGTGEGDILFIDDVANGKLSLREVQYLNTRIDEVVDIIKRKKFSPYEAMIYIHNYITSFKYTKGSNSQLIVGPLLGNNVVCSGYASLTKAIIDKLNMPGLKCEIKGFNSINSDKTGYGNLGHAQCLIHIQDKKYDIDGSYYNDATGDNMEYDKSISDVGRFSFFLYPRTDVSLTLNGKEPIFYVDDKARNRYQQIISSKANTIILDFAKVSLKEKFVTSKNKLIGKAVQGVANPIPVQTLMKGLYNVLEKDKSIKFDYGYNSTEDAVLNIMLNSIVKSDLKYRPEAQNDMIKTLKRFGYYRNKDREGVISKIVSFMNATLDDIVLAKHNEKCRLYSTKIPNMQWQRPGALRRCEWAFHELRWSHQDWDSSVG